VKFIKQADTISIKRMIHALVGGMEDARSNKKIHASDLTNEDREFCPRERVLVSKLDLKPKPRMISAPMRMTFDLGWATQQVLNDKWLRDRMVGSWKCQSCSATRAFTPFPKDGCNNIKAWCNWKYQEMVFIHQDIPMFSGSIDAFVDVGQPKLHMVEVKIMDKDYFKALKAPLSEHKLRTNLYLRLIAESTTSFKEFIDTSVATVLYVMRGFGSKGDDGEISPLKEFHVKRNDADTDHLIKLAADAAKGLEGGDIPDGICHSMTCPRASKCPVASECFSGKWGSFLAS